MPADLTEPEADINVTFVDFEISVEGTLTAGDHILRLENLGAEPHFIDLLEAPDAVTDDDVSLILAASMGGPDVTPVALPYDPDTDFTDVFSTAPQSIGTVQWTPVTLEAGTYVALCFVPTAGTGVPHSMNGMHTVFKVTGWFQLLCRSGNGRTVCDGVQYRTPLQPYAQWGFTPMRGTIFGGRVAEPPGGAKSHRPARRDGGGAGR